MILDTTSKVLRIVLGENHTTNQCKCVSSWTEGAAPNIFNPGNTNILTNDTTPVIVVGAPSKAGRYRDAREVRVNNNDTVTHTITLQIYDGATAWPIAPSNVSVPAGGAFVYTPEASITVVQSGGTTAGITVVDGNGTTINGVTSLTLAGPTVTGSSPNATATLVPRGYIDGLQITVASTTSFAASAGQATSSDGTAVMNLASAITKLTGGTWVAGNNQNGLDTGTIANSTTYHAYLIFNPSTLVTDVLFSTNATTPSLPSGFTKFRRIFSFYTGASTAPLVTVIQNGDRFDLGTPIQDTLGTPGVTTALTQTLSVPTGIVVEAILSGFLLDATGSNTALYLSSLAQTNVAAGAGLAMTTEQGAAAATGLGTYSGFRVITDTAAGIRRRVSTTTAQILIVTNGWIDRRGKQ
jgi:hypothetical protein